MATLSGNTVTLTSISDSAGLVINSGEATMELPVANSTGASVGIPQVLAVTEDGGGFDWHPLVGSGGSSGFNAAASYIIRTPTTATSFTIAEMAPDLTGPIAVKMTMIGSGGGGNGCTQGGSNNQTSNSGGGGGAGASVKWFSGLIPASAFIVTVGAGGVGGAPGANLGTTGVPTLVVFDGDTYGATPGSASTTNVFTAGLGGAAAIAQGADAASDMYFPGGVGGPGFSFVATVAGLISQPSGCGGASLTCPSVNVGNISVTAGAVVGTTAAGPGGGGAGGFITNGSANAGGGAGAPGAVIFEFFGTQA